MQARLDEYAFVNGSITVDQRFNMMITVTSYRYLDLEIASYSGGRPDLPKHELNMSSQFQQPPLGLRAVGEQSNIVTEVLKSTPKSYHTAKHLRVRTHARLFSLQVAGERACIKNCKAPPHDHEFAQCQQQEQPLKAA